jgi:hypothetical protein
LVFGHLTHSENAHSLPKSVPATVQLLESSRPELPCRRTSEQRDVDYG